MVIFLTSSTISGQRGLCSSMSGELSSGGAPTTTVEEVLPPECRMRKWVLVHMVLVHQATSGLVKQLGIHLIARDVRTKGRLLHIPGHSPSREKFRYVLDSDILRAPMVSCKCPRQSLTEPLQTAHHSTGHRHNCPNWEFVMWMSKADAIST